MLLYSHRISGLNSFQIGSHSAQLSVDLLQMHQSGLMQATLQSKIHNSVKRHARPLCRTLGLLLAFISLLGKTKMKAPEEIRQGAIQLPRYQIGFNFYGAAS